MSSFEDMDSLHLDYVRYPDNPLPPCFAKQHGLEYRYREKYDYGYTEAALTKFYREHGYDPSRLEPHMEEYKTWSRWRANQVTELLHTIRRDLDIKLGVDVFPTPELAFKHVLQRWEEWVSDVSLIVPMLYNKYWCAKGTWILSIVKDLLRRGLQVIPGVHLDQIKVSHPARFSH